MIQFELDGRLPGLNEMLGSARSNRFGAAAEKKRLTKRCADACRGKGKFDGPVHVEIYWFERDIRRDADNLTAGQKFILDGLVEAGVIPNDNRKFVPQPPRHFVAVDKRRPRIVVVVKEIS